MNKKKRTFKGKGAVANDIDTETRPHFTVNRFFRVLADTEILMSQLVTRLKTRKSLRYKKILSAGKRPARYCYWTEGFPENQIALGKIHTQVSPWIRVEVKYGREGAKEAEFEVIWVVEV